MNLISGQDEYETLETFFSNVDLSFAEKLVHECFHVCGHVDPRFRKICLIEEGEKGYPRSVLSRFARKVGVDRLKSIIEEKVVELLKRSEAKEVDAVLDASFIKAWSIRHPRDSRKGYSDTEARVGRKVERTV